MSANGLKQDVTRTTMYLCSTTQRMLSNILYLISAKLNFPSGFGTDSRIDLTLWLLKLLGCCPLSESSGATCKYYHIIWQSPSTILSFCASFYFAFTYVISITHVTFKKFFLFGESIRQIFTHTETIIRADVSVRQSTANFTAQALNAVVMCSCLFGLVNTILSWQSGFKLVKYLNNWLPIQKRCLHIFPIEGRQPQQNSWELNFYPQLAGQKPFHWFDVGLCCYVIFLGLFPGFGMVTMIHSAPVSELWLNVSTITHKCLSEVLEDSKNVLIYRSLSDAFENIRTCINKSVKREKPTVLAVQCWREILEQIRSQCTLAGQCLMPLQLTFLLNLLLVGTICVYVSVNGFGNGRLSILVAVMNGSIATVLLGRLYFKILYAEKIMEAERAVARSLMEMDCTGCSSLVMSQIRMTHDVLVKTPSRINFGNYVVLNKRLFLGISGQIITYLVVLMQFFSSLMVSKLSTYSNSVFPKSMSPIPLLGTDEKLDFVLRLQTFVGYCPISSGGSREKYYFFEWATPTVAISFVAALYFGFSYVIFITHTIFKWYFLFGEEIRYTFTRSEEKFKNEILLVGANKSAAQNTFYAVLLFMAFQELVMLVSSWESSSKLAGFLNNWASLRKQFSQTFTNEDRPQSELLQLNPPIGPLIRTRIAWSDILLCCYVLGSVLFPIVLTSMVLDTNTPMVQIWSLITYSCHYITTEVLEDVKNALIYKSCRDAFKQTRSRIAEAIHWGKLNEDKVQAWRHLIKEIQSQCELAGICIMPMQLTFLLNILISGTMCIYVCMNSLGSSLNSIATSFFTGSMFLWWIARLYFKVLLAEKITAEEAEIAADLIKMNSTGYNTSVMSQIRLTLDTLVQNPSRINLGNYVVLDKHLFLGIIGQVITYLIVLMQFFQTSNPTN
ncbi:unnamed protein product [Allacma fusca]|uniref:Gustatory receptor n=1 Tax=Allacma fusca TaxID=39272 RepID=A0A8J2K1S6_9HEXA|nr:unnamed protein product [Allacma fusca]